MFSNNSDAVNVLRMSIEINNKNLAELMESLSSKLIPRLVQGKVEFQPTPAFEAALEKEAKLRVGIQLLEKKMAEVEALLDEADKIHSLPERSLSGVLQSAMYYINKNAIAASDAKIEVEMLLNRGLPTRSAMESYLDIVEERSPAVQANIKKAEELRQIANKIRTLCV